MTPTAETRKNFKRPKGYAARWRAFFASKTRNMATGRPEAQAVALAKMRREGRDEES